jgi:hypothetical protein
MDDDAFQEHNPYASPESRPAPEQGTGRVKGKVVAPAIALMVVGILGLAFSLLNVVVAIIQPVQPIDPNAPEFIQEIQRQSAGPLAAVLQSVFLIVNTLIIFGALKMMKLRSWGWAMTSTVLAMVNVGTCCCVVGLPIGIWSVVILSMEDVKQAFAVVAARPANGFDPYRQ